MFSGEVQTGGIAAAQIAQNPNDWREECIAMDYAAGVAPASIVSTYDLTSEAALAAILVKPRVAGLVATYKREMVVAATHFMFMQKIAAKRSLRQLMEYTASAPLESRTAIGVRKWFVDAETQRVAPPPPPPLPADHPRAVSMDVVVRLEQSVKPLLAQPVIDISAEDVHLHGGKEFMDKRDRQLAALGDVGERDSG